MHFNAISWWCACTLNIEKHFLSPHLCEAAWRRKNMLSLKIDSTFSIHCGKYWYLFRLQNSDLILRCGWACSWGNLIQNYVQVQVCHNYVNSICRKHYLQITKWKQTMSQLTKKGRPMNQNKDLKLTHFVLLQYLQMDNLIYCYFKLLFHIFHQFSLNKFYVFVYFCK